MVKLLQRALPRPAPPRFGRVRPYSWEQRPASGDNPGSEHAIQNRQFYLEIQRVTEGDEESPLARIKCRLGGFFVCSGAMGEYRLTRRVRATKGATRWKCLRHTRIAFPPRSGPGTWFPAPGKADLALSQTWQAFGQKKGLRKKPQHGGQNMEEKRGRGERLHGLLV